MTKRKQRIYGIVYNVALIVTSSSDMLILKAKKTKKKGTMPRTSFLYDGAMMAICLLNHFIINLFIIGEPVATLPGSSHKHLMFAPYAHNISSALRTQSTGGESLNKHSAYYVINMQTQTFGDIKCNPGYSLVR